jgi:hypothetical protein
MNTANRTKPISFSARRVRNVCFTVLSIAILAVIVYAQNQSLMRSSFTTGYLLIGSIVFLASFNLRKKLTFLPAIGSAAFWMQIHIYVGLATFAVFGFHIAWHVPNGWFESFLAVLYLAVAGSGVYGLYATRVLPKRLTAIPDEVVYERIPWLRNQIAIQAKSIVLAACESSDVLAKFYANRLSSYFERPRSLAYLVHPSGRVRRQLVAEIEELDRFLADDQRQVSRGLSSLVKRKDDLDYHHALQGRLKVWLFVHIGLTYSLLAVSFLHMILAHAFHGGL